MATLINASTMGVGGLVTTADNTGILQLQTAGSTALTIDGSQNVGIGTTSPTCKIDTTGTVRTTGAGAPTSGAGVEIDYGSIASATGRIFAFDRTASARKDMAIDGANTLIYTGGTERMRIDSSGNLLLTGGTTTGMTKLANMYNATEATLLLGSGSAGTEGITFRDQGASNNWGGIEGVNNSGSNPYIKFNNNGERMRIDSSGNVGIEIGRAHV